MSRFCISCAGLLLLPALLTIPGGEAMSAEATMPTLRNPHVRRGLEIRPEGATVVVTAGECQIGGRTVRVPEPATLPVEPSPILAAADESVRLSPDAPKWYNKGTRLRGPNARDVNAFGSLVPGSLEIRRTKGGDLLVEGQDYLVDVNGAHVGLGPQSRVTAQDTVYATYRYSLMRMDTVQVTPDGKVALKAGPPHITAPVPPDADAGCLALAHVWMTYRATEVKPDQIYLIAEAAEQAVTRTTPGRIPKTLAKIRAGEPVKIVCWGDSVTAGGNSSKPELRYSDVFAAGLKERFPAAKITMENISIGGSNSFQWLFPEKANLRPDWVPICTFQRILDAKPDLVTIEFVNDAGLNEQGVEERYSDILKRLEPTGAEVILITPHFTMLRMMKFDQMWEAEKRPYVLGLRTFAEKHGVALADASARWEHLWKEGIPYLTLLHNSINHPDDRGHRLFAEELWKCF